MENQRRAQNHAGHGISGFEMTAIVLQNLNKFKLSNSAKVVLWYLASCHNGKKGYVFPKQKTIAQKMGISERSVIRGIQELVKEGVILVECNLSNKYFWGSKIVSQCPHFLSDENMSGDNDKISSTNDKLSLPHVHEQTKEQIQEQEVVKNNCSIVTGSQPTNYSTGSAGPVKVDDYKILKDYAAPRVKNKEKLTAYVNKLIKNGAADKIIKDAKLEKAVKRAAQKQIQETTKLINEWSSWTADNPQECETWVALKAKLKGELCKK